jgi:hypothetical protein
MPAFQPYWGKLAVRNDRGDRGNVGIIRSPVRTSILPDPSGHWRGSLQLGFAVKLRGLNVTPAPLLPIAALRCSTIAGNQLDQIGLARGGGFLKQAVQMCSDRGLDDAEHTGDLGHAVHLDDGKKHAQFRRG